MSVVEFQDFNSFTADFKSAKHIASDNGQTAGTDPESNVIETTVKSQVINSNDKSSDAFTDEDSSSLQESLKTITEYSSEDRCKQLSTSELRKMLTNCYLMKRDVWLKDSDIAIWSYGTSPDGFYLKWTKNIYPSELLCLWLTHMAGSNRCQEVDWVRVGNKYAVEFDVDKKWYRGQVVRIVNSEIVECLFIDRGNVERCYIDQLRVLSEEIANIPSYAFKCKLLHIGAVDQIEGRDLLRFATKLKTIQNIRCRLVGMLKKCSGFDVELWDDDNPSFNFVTIFSKNVANEFIDSDDNYIVEPFLEDRPLEEEAKDLIHQNAELQFAKRLRGPTKAHDSYSIEEAVDPGEIYVWNLASPDAETVKTLQTELNKFYCNAHWKSQYQIKTTRLFKHRPYAWFNQSRNCWERVTVIRVDTSVGQVFIQRIDHGSKLLVNVEDMAELSQRFCAWPPKVDLAHLVHIKPKGGSQYWKREVCDSLKSLVTWGKIHFGTVFAWEASVYNSVGDLPTWKSLGLLLNYVDKVPFSLQGLLVHLGFAEGTGIGAGNPNVIYIKQGLPVYRNFETSLGKSLNNSTTILSETTIKETRKFPYSMPGNIEHLESINPDWCKTKRNTQRDLLPEEIRVSLGWIKFTHLISPSHFYLQMRSRETEFDKMTEDLARSITPSPLPSERILTEKFVAVFFVHEKSSDVKPTWNRALVLNANVKLQQAHVLLLDYGFETIIQFEYIRLLPEGFRNTLPYCRRAHLHFRNLVPTANLRWSDAAKSNFKAYIEAWTVESPVYLAFQQDASQQDVILPSIDQELQYSFELKDWTPIPIKGIREGLAQYVWLNDYKSDKLLKYLFESVPLLIYYEVESDSNSFYSYRPVWDILIDNGFLMKV